MGKDYDGAAPCTAWEAISLALSVMMLAPLGSVVVWFALVAYLIARDRFHTWTEVFFLAGCAFVGGYAFSDVLFFSAPSESGAILAAYASLACLTFAAYFFMMYGVVLHGRLRRGLFLAIVPPALALAFLPTEILAGVRPPYEPIGINWLAEYHPPGFAAWVLLLFVYVLLSMVYINRTYREVKRQAPSLSRRLRNVLLGFFAAVYLAVLTNTAIAATGRDLPPVLSSAFVLPGILLFFAMSPLSERSVREVLLRRKSQEYEIEGAFVLHEDGTLIGSEVAPGQTMVDRDIFSGTLDTIQNFMRSSFPALRGKWLQSIRHGDYTLVMERGRCTSAVVVIKGLENDQLRRHVREALDAFEGENHTVLEHWRGAPEDATNLGGLMEALIGEG